MTRHWSDRLVERGACEDGLLWARRQPSLAVAWRECPRGDWMLWLAGRVSLPDSEARRRLVLAACACARLALPYVPPGECRPLRAIETAERWARGEHGVTLDDVRDAGADSAAASSASSAAAAAYAAAAAEARATMLRHCADSVRLHYPRPPRLPRTAR